MSETKNKGLKVTLGAVFFSLFTSALYDLIKSKPFLSTLLAAVKWISNFFTRTYSMTMWSLVLLFTLGAGLMLLWVILASKTDENKTINDGPSWLEYTEDIFYGILVKWSYNYSILDGGWIRGPYRFCCPKDGCELHHNQCPVCNSHYNTNLVDVQVISKLITNKIESKTYPPKINPI